MSFVCSSDKSHRGGEVGSQTYRPWLGHGLAAPWHRRGDAPRCRSPPPRLASAQDPYSVLVFTKNATVGAAEGVAALQASAPPGATFDVSADASKFTDAGLAPYKAVVFLNTTGDVLDAAQQTAFEKYFSAGGGFLGIGSAIETEPDWQFLTDILGTRSTGASEADAGDDQGRRPRSCRGRQGPAGVLARAPTAGTTSPPTCAASRTSSPPSTRRPTRAATRWRCRPAPTIPSSGARTTRAAAPSTPRGGNTAAAFGEAQFRAHLGGAVQWAAGKADPVYSDCGATVLANYEQTKISAPPNLNEPIGFDQLPDGRIIQTARARPGAPARPGHGHLADHREHPGLHQLRGRPLRPRGRQRLRHQQVGLPLLRAADRPHQAVRRHDGRRDDARPARRRPSAADPCVLADTWAGYFQLSRFKFVDGETPSLDLASEQKIMQVPSTAARAATSRGDIDFDKNNNLWMVTGDDTPAGGGNSGGFGRFNDRRPTRRRPSASTTPPAAPSR